MIESVFYNVGIYCRLYLDDGNVDVKSELMSIIENSGQVNTQRDDWMSTMV